MLKEHDPQNPASFKRLTWKEDGETNNTCVRIDGYEDLFGKPPGDWVRDKGGRLRTQEALPKGRHGWMSFWQSRGIRFRQTVEVVTNEQTRLLDTCLIHYLVENKDTVPHKVGLRVMLDTFIGANDGVPFAIPGQPGLLETMKRFNQKEIPDYVQALERSDLKDPGTIAHLGLRLQGIKVQRDDPDLEPLQSLLICRWPGTSEIKWDWQPRAMSDKAGGETVSDSCVALYWAEETMKPGDRRAMAFTYGLGIVSSAETGQLGVNVGGTFRPGSVFTVMALVKNPQEGQKVKLILPDGLMLDDSTKQTAVQEVKKGTAYSQVSWRVRALKPDDYHVEVASGLAHAYYRVRIRPAGLFD
jgi:hypothetical protein